MSEANAKILEEAVARNSSLVLSLPSAGMLRHCKSRFVGESEDGLWIEGAPAERGLIDGLIVEGKPCGVAFKAGDKKVTFVVPLLKVDSEYRMNAGTVVSAVLIGRPADVKAVQRRSSYRVQVPSDTELRVRVWRIAERADLRDEPMSATELNLHVRDISMGGLGVNLLPKDGQAPRALPEERVRVLMTYGATRLLVEGRMRHPTPGKGDAMKTGVHFTSLENALQGRQAMTDLAKIVAELQREEVRRLRMGITAA